MSLAVARPLEQQLIPAGMLQPCPGAGNLQEQLWGSLALVAVMAKGNLCLGFSWCWFALGALPQQLSLHPRPFPMELLNGAALEQLIRAEVPSREAPGHGSASDQLRPLPLGALGAFQSSGLSFPIFLPAEGVCGAATGRGRLPCAPGEGNS